MEKGNAAVAVAPMAPKNRFVAKYFNKTTAVKILWSIFRLLLLIGLSYIIFLPFLIKLSNAFMSKSDLFDSMVKFFPREPTTANLEFVFEYMKYPQTFCNTLILSLLCALIQTFVGCMVGYGLAKYNFAGKKVLLGFVVLTMVIPPQTIQMASYLKFKFFDFFGIISMITGQSPSLIGNISPMIFLSFTGLAIKNGLYIFIMRQCFAGVPQELSEAASVDGAGVFRIFLQINMPSVRPMMVTIFLLSFSWQWLDTYYASMYYPNYEVLSNMIDQVVVSFTDVLGKLQPGSPLQSMIINTASLVVMFPLLVLYFFAQKAFVQGIERSGIVG